MICALCSMLMALLSLFLRLSKMACQYPHPGADLVVNDTTYKFGGNKSGD